MPVLCASASAPGQQRRGASLAASPPPAQHYTDQAMQRWFKESGGNVTHADVLRHFSTLRHMGVRLHYWP